MASIGEAEKLFRGKHKPLLPIFEALYKLLVGKLKCDPRVETIYVGFSVDNGVVASVHPQDGFLEVALALPEDTDSALLHDASHLKWRTLPVSVDIPDKAVLKETEPLLQEAVRRVNAGEHDVRLANRRFASRPKYDRPP